MQKALQFDLLPVFRNWRSSLLLNPVLKQCGEFISWDLLNPLLYDLIHLVLQIQHNSVCLQLRICRAMFGSVDKFCIARL